MKKSLRLVSALLCAVVCFGCPFCAATATNTKRIDDCRARPTHDYARCGEGPTASAS
jgi:hypothetical protein